MRKSVRALVLVLLMSAGCHAPFRVWTHVDGRLDATVDGKLATTVEGKLDTTSRVVVETPIISDGGDIQTVALRSGHATPDSKRIAIVDVDGLLVNHPIVGPGSMGENPVGVFREKLETIQLDPQVIAIVLRINSPGGSVTASDILRNELKRFKERSKLPIVACIMDVGAGGGYYLASIADEIIAHPTSVVGGVGVVLNLYNLQDLMAQVNIVPQGVKSGDLIDLGSPVRNLPEAGRKLLQQMANEYHERFITEVKASRPMVKNEDGATFDGRVFTSRQALDRKLIDAVGYLDDAIVRAGERGQCANAVPVLYRRKNDPARSPYAVTPNIPLQSVLMPSIPGLDRSRLPTFLFLWQPETATERLGGR